MGLSLSRVVIHFKLILRCLDEGIGKVPEILDGWRGQQSDKHDRLHGRPVVSAEILGVETRIPGIGEEAIL